jgi:hypothetical protein
MDRQQIDVLKDIALDDGEVSMEDTVTRPQTDPSVVAPLRYR